MNTLLLKKFYDFLASHMGKDIAEGLAIYIEHKVRAEMERNSKTLSTKEDIERLELKVVNSKFDLIKWIFAFGITLCTIIIVLYFVLMKYFCPL